MMHRLLAVSVLAALALTGCKSSPDAATLQAENESLRAQLDQANKALETAERERQAAEARASESQAKDDTASKDFEGIEFRGGALDGARLDAGDAAGRHRH